MQENPPRILQCLGELTEDEVWKRPNENSNSVGNLILHLCGNIRQYGIASLGHQPDHRVRDAEFEARGGFSKDELQKRLETTVSEAFEVIRSTTDEEMMRVRTVQGFQMSGIGICVHICEHLSYHTGQIAFWTKLLRNKDLAFYGGINLNVTGNLTS
ncbi:MAG: DUF1572 family protein [Saprospiraceae bacterium]|nr:DUF1572 family protein [Saprospiraceae bacterium]